MNTHPPIDRPLRHPEPSEGLPVPHNEMERLSAVTGLNQTHSEEQPALIALRNTAQRLLRAPIAFIGFIEEEEQRLLTVCIIPQEANNQAEGVDFKEMLTPRDCSVCQFTIMEQDHLVIPDLGAFMNEGNGQHYPEAFRQQAEEVGGYPIPWPNEHGAIELRPAHFYAGAVIRTRSGMPVGTFCVVDVVPRPDFGIAEIEILESLAAQAAEYLEERALLRRPANLHLLQKAQSRESTHDEHPASGAREVDAVVLGAGPAGTTAACRLSFQGLEVALVEPKSEFGAPTGVNSKVLREVAREHGKQTTWEQILAVRDLIGKQDAARVATQLERYGVSLMQGRGKITGTAPDTGYTQVMVQNKTGQESLLTARATVLSTGSKARRLPHIPFDDRHIFDSDSINGLGRKPASLFIQGTGVIALEYATIFATMGVQVTLAARGAREKLLPRLDGALREALLDELEAQGVEILYHCNVEEWKTVNGAAELTLKLPEGAITRRFEAAMSAVGRLPATANIGLDTLPQGASETTDERLRLAGPHNPVYAVGDCSGSGLACRAVVEAQQVVDDLLPQLVHEKSPKDTLMTTQGSKLGTASVIWAIPELAFVGLTEAEAQDQFGADQVFTVVAPFSDTIRGSLSNLPDTHFLKLVCLSQDGRILGGHIYGEGASELIHLGASLVASGETVFKLQYRTFPAVTLHEVYRNAALHAIEKLAKLVGPS